MKLYRVCYRSRINWDRVTRPLHEEVERSLNRIRRINRRAGVTGALFLTDDHIVQVLEGMPGPVLDTVFCVMTDPRLHSLEAIFQEPAEERMFPNCLMLFRDLTDGLDATAHPELKPMLDETGTLSREAALSALNYYSGEMLEGRLTNNMLMI